MIMKSLIVPVFIAFICLVVILSPHISARKPSRLSKPNRRHASIEQPKRPDVDDQRIVPPPVLIINNGPLIIIGNQDVFRPTKPGRQGKIGRSSHRRKRREQQRNSTRGSRRKISPSDGTHFVKYIEIETIRLKFMNSTGQCPKSKLLTLDLFINGRPPIDEAAQIAKLLAENRKPRPSKYSPPRKSKSCATIYFAPGYNGMFWDLNGYNLTTTDGVYLAGTASLGRSAADVGHSQDQLLCKWDIDLPLKDHRGTKRLDDNDGTCQLDIQISVTSE